MRLFFLVVVWAAMKNTKHMFIGALFFFSLFGVSANASSSEPLLDGYHTIQTALARDEFTSVKDLSARLLTEIDAWLKNEKEGTPQYQSITFLRKGTESLAGTDVEAEQRQHFGVFSEGMVGFIRQDPALKARYQLFFCPMVMGFAYWVQPMGEKINNPYMGLSMPKCGSKKPW